MQLEQKLKQVCKLSSSLSIQGSKKVKPDEADSALKSISALSSALSSRRETTMQSRTRPISPRDQMIKGPSFKSPRDNTKHETQMQPENSDEEGLVDEQTQKKGFVGWVSERKES